MAIETTAPVKTSSKLAIGIERCRLSGFEDGTHYRKNIVQFPGYGRSLVPVGLESGLRLTRKEHIAAYKLGFEQGAGKTFDRAKAGY